MLYCTLSSRFKLYLKMLCVVNDLYIKLTWKQVEQFTVVSFHRNSVDTRPKSKRTNKCSHIPLMIAMRDMCFDFAVLR